MTIGRYVNDEHNERLHSGLRFDLTLPDEALADDASICLGIDLKGNDHIYAEVSGGAAGDSVFYFFEDAVFSGGTEQTPRNTNRIYGSDTVTASFMKNPTVTATGTRLDYGLVIGGPYSTGGKEHNTFMLDKDKKYFAKLVNRSGGATVAEVKCDFWLE